MKKNKYQKYLDEFDKEFIARNDCSNKVGKHRDNCQGCVNVLVEEPEDIKDFLVKALEEREKELLDEILNVGEEK